MNMRDLIPWGRHERSSSVPTSYRGEEVSPFLTLHREMNRLFDDVFSRFEGGLAGFGRMPAWPSVEIVETEKDVRIAAELPGMDENDVELTVSDDVLTIRGEKKTEVKDEGRHFSERYYGHFERRIPLPFEVEDDQAEASFENGVLTVTLPKSAKAEARTKRIAIKGKMTDTKH
jgi:HSP20 family protein